MERRSVVTSFLEYEGRILLLRRSGQVRTYQGRWAGVSGSIESGRTPEQQARTEIREETELTDDDIRLVADGEPLAVDDPGGERRWLVHPFRFLVLHPERIHLDWEHVEMRWLDPADLDTFETVPNLVETWRRVSTLIGPADPSSIDFPSPSPMESGPGSEATPLVARIAERLGERKETVAVAESAAGGRISDLLTERPGSSAWLAGSVLPYSNASKQQVAGIPADILSRFGAVSPETAAALAEGARRLFGATWGIGETGIAGPQIGRRSTKPAGLAYVAVVGPGNLRRTIDVNTGSDARAENKQAFAIAALTLLVEELEKQP